MHADHCVFYFAGVLGKAPRRRNAVAGMVCRGKPGGLANAGGHQGGYRNASFTANNRVVFNIKGNDYRLVVAVHYDRGQMFIRFVGNHRQYDKINVETI